MKKALKYWVLRVLVWMCLTYAIVTAWVWWGQESFLLFPTPTAPDFVYSYAADEVYLETEDTIKLHGLHFKNNEAKALLLYFHGNAQSLESWGGVCNDFVRLGFECLIFDYRGFGKSGGRVMHEAQWLSDAELMHAYAIQQTDLPIVLYGRSIGTSAVAYLSGKHEFKRIVLEASPTSFLALAQAQFGWLPVKTLFRYPFENQRWLMQNQNKTMLVHGTDDLVVPYSHFENLQSGLENSNNYQFATVEGGGHNNLSQFQSYWGAIERFLVFARPQ